jgi:hypothetical protein
MIISAFDPGISTGAVSIFFDETVTPFVWTLRARATLDPNFRMIDNLDLLVCNIAIIERLPPQISQELSAIISSINYAVKSQSFDVNGEEPLFKTIYPGNWKPLARARQWRFSVASTQHERDAFFMLRFYIWSKYSFDLGDL